jgi:phenylacetic acid degradation operon negative regulatory protein
VAYEEFVETFGAADPATPDEVLRHQIHLVHAWRRFPFLDPQLPAALLPDDWAGARAAALFSRQHERWHQPAQQRWQELAGSTG